jgi:tripartite-type tricarboxylate transporter receptor subunit TctC
MKRRLLLAAGFGALAAPAVARANTRFPDRTIRLVVPFPAGGATDVVGRMFADKLSHLLGQTVVVDNKGGAAGSIGAMEVKNARPDGYTLLVATSSTHAINPTAFVHPPYDPIKDFTPIASVCINPLVFFANPSLPPTVTELVQLMKKNPGKYSYGSAGIGSIIHLAAEYLKRSVGGMDVVHVPYKGGAPAIQDTIAGNVAWSMETFSTTLALHRAGKLRIEAFCHSQRAAIAPDVPTMIEAGVPGYEAYTFSLILGPPGMPPEVVDVLDKASRQAMGDASTIKFLEGNASIPTPDTTPERTAQFIRDELAKWAPIIRDADVKIA